MSKFNQKDEAHKLLNDVFNNVDIDNAKNINDDLITKIYDASAIYADKNNIDENLNKLIDKLIINSIKEDSDV